MLRGHSLQLIAFRIRSSSNMFTAHSEVKEMFFIILLNLFPADSVLTLFSAAGNWGQLELSQLSSDSHPTCLQRGCPAWCSQTLAVRCSPFFRAQTSASCPQSFFSAPTSAITSPCWGLHQGHRIHTKCHYSCHHISHFRQAFPSHSTAGQNSWKRGGQVWGRTTGGRGRVSMKKNANILFLFTDVISKHASFSTLLQPSKEINLKPKR